MWRCGVSRSVAPSSAFLGRVRAAGAAPTARKAASSAASLNSIPHSAVPFDRVCSVVRRRVSTHRTSGGYRCSSSAASSKSSATAPAHGLRNLIKPFLLRFHPDVQQSDEARAVNLVAVQNLNSYLDLVSDALKFDGNLRGPPPGGSTRVVTIDFCLVQPGPLGKKKVETHHSRRRVDLLVPFLPPQDDASSSARRTLERRASRELVKLLRVAGLPVPASTSGTLDYNEDREGDGETLYHRRPTQTSAESIYRANRDRFTAQIDWKRLDRACRAAEADMRADILTSGLVRNHAARRRGLIAQVLSRADCPNLDVRQQLVSLRRLSLLLQEHFDLLQLEDLGACWEQLRLVVYDPIAAAEDGELRGFAFALGPDHSVTVRIPVDFTDEEFVRELNRNLWDFVEVLEDEQPENSIIPEPAR